MLGIIALALPVLELVGIYQAWQVAGWWTLVWLAGAALFGLWLMALERLAFLPRLAAAMSGGGAPFSVLTGSGLRFIAAGMLVFPGFISDALALALLIGSVFLGGSGGKPARDAGRRTHAPRAANDDVIEGECRRVD